MALAERTWERVGERKRDRARLIESTAYDMQAGNLVEDKRFLCLLIFPH